MKYLATRLYLIRKNESLLKYGKQINLYSLRFNGSKVFERKKTYKKHDKCGCQQ